MRRRIAAIFLLLIVVMGNAPAFAHDTQDKHDDDLKYVLFGSRDNKTLNAEETLLFSAIANAAALTIDQFSPNDRLRWKENVYNQLQDTLQTLKLPGLPDGFDKIDLNSRIVGKNVVANFHREYTHLGWNYQGYPNEKFWEKRKPILLHTVNWTLFQGKTLLSRIPWLSDVLYRPNEQCEAFCIIIYDIHILGDHIVGDTPDKLSSLEPLIQYNGFSESGIRLELIEQLKTVFAAQKDSRQFNLLIQEIQTLKFELEKEQIYDAVGSVKNPDKCKTNKEYANKLLDLLSTKLPELLKNEPFFADHVK